MTHEILKHAREARGWSPDQLASRSGVRLKTIELIERGDFAALPAGLYCRSSIRNYASAVGLNPEDVLEALRPCLPVPEDPLDGLARRCGHARRLEPKPQEGPLAQASQGEPDSAPDPVAPRAEPMVHLAVVVDQMDEPAGEVMPLVSDGLAAGDLAEIRIRPIAEAEIEWTEAPEILLHTEPPVPEGTRQWWRPLAASAIDGVLLATMGAVLVWLTAIACGTSIPVAVRVGAPGMAVVFVLIVALYFVLFGGVGNATVGVSLMRLSAPRPGRVVLNPREVFGRARRSIFGDNSLLAE